MRTSNQRRLCLLLTAMTGAFLAYFGSIRNAGAVPSFARKYETSCITCHTIFPILNSFGEALRRDRYRFPSQGGSVDSDAMKAETIAMGQDEYKKTFPDSVWSDKITKAVPLSLMNGAVNIPGSDAHDAAAIKDVPSGTYKITAWAPRQQPVTQPITVKDTDVPTTFVLHR